MISPSSLAVRELKFLQKSMILTPCGPSAVPTGGAGVALPAAIWSFTIACTFFAMLNIFSQSSWGPAPQRVPSRLSPLGCGCDNDVLSATASPNQSLNLLHL